MKMRIENENRKNWAVSQVIELRKAKINCKQMLAKMLKNLIKWEISENCDFSLTKIQDNG